MRKLFAALFVAALLLAGGTANASPTNVRFTQDHSPVHVNELVTYTGTGTCDTATCRPQFRIFGPGYSRTGTVLCECSVFTTKWSAPGNYLLSFKLTNSNGTNGYGQWDAYTTVVA